jgi:hypothetical protein
MLDFPDKLNVNNKCYFMEYYFNRIVSYLRRDIYEHILCNSEMEYYDLETFFKKYKIDKKKTSEMSTKIIGELELLGWTCKLSFGGTGLFIYSDKDNPPSNYYVDGI